MSLRWDRLTESLAAAGVETTVNRRSSINGTSESITIRRGDVNVCVHDKWWSKNRDVWVGWQVHDENVRTSLTLSVGGLTKKRSEVIRDVLERLARADAASS
jgi:hypothetical protein